MPMTEREIIDRTLLNMQRLYQHWGEIAAIIEEKIVNAYFEGEKPLYVRVEPSGSLDKAEQWMPRNIARFYKRQRASTKGVGVCLHLGLYSPHYVDWRPGKTNVTLPAASVSLVEVDNRSDFNSQRRLHKVLFEAGWANITGQRIVRNVLVESSVKTLKAKAVTYFVDLFKLRTDVAIAQTRGRADGEDVRRGTAIRRPLGRCCLLPAGRLGDYGGIDSGSEMLAAELHDKIGGAARVRVITIIDSGPITIIDGSCDLVPVHIV